MQKYGVRIKIVTGIIQISEGEELAVWQWLERLLELLGVDGMSSDDSDIENEEQIFRVKIMPWRADIVNYLDQIDRHRRMDLSIFTKRGSQGVRRMLGADHHISTRKAKKGLPLPLYDARWLADDEIPERRETALHVSREQFEWMFIGAGHQL